MKRSKVRQLVADVLDARAGMPDQPVTFDQLVVDFDERTVTIRGNKVRVTSKAIVIPVLNTDRYIMPREGTVL